MAVVSMFAAIRKLQTKSGDFLEVSLTFSKSVNGPVNSEDPTARKQSTTTHNHYFVFMRQ